MADLALSAASPVVGPLVEKLASGLWKELGMLRSVYTDLEKLKRMLSTIQGVLDDAERKSITSKPLQLWLRNHRGAALDAEDVVEECEAEALRRTKERHDRMTGKVRDFCSINNNPIKFRYKIAGKIREIRERFDEITKESRDFNLMGKSDSDTPVDRETSSLVLESEIFGRDDDKKEVIEFLVDKDNDKNISILSIVGLGGVGKTTLAQLVYNDEKIKEKFELRMWVCVGEKFDVKMVMQKMIEQVKGEQRNSSSLETMSTFLQEELRAKRFLLVLDDLWTDRESEWEKLKPLFIDAQLGSKIIVTTSQETVASAASTIGTVSVHKLQGLQDDDCWTLFEQRAFKSVKEEDNPELVEIGREIIKKCGGLPLAAKALGSLMSTKRGKAEWLAIQNNEIWKLSEDELGILPALKLSYDHLPSHLKRCFTYCSVFPKDYEFEIKRLIQLWMAEGLIDSSVSAQNAEDIGRRYFDSLLWRSFFQDVRMDEYNNIETCKMHDLVHDLACSLTKGESLVMEMGRENILHECRYFSVVLDDVSSITSISEAKKLRSLLLLRRQRWGDGSYGADEIFFNITKKCTQIRALDLSWSGIEKLSDRMSRLKQLRFLDLSGSHITTLPTSITRLYNLQTLNLRQCNQLRELPEGIRKLSNLRHIDISWCPNIITLPTSISRLYNLQTLNLWQCNQLRELPEGISNLSNLRHIDISWCHKITTLPTSVTRLSNLQTLNLQQCIQLRELPEGISNLSKLRHLDISNCCGLSCMPRYLGRLSNLETLPMFIVGRENGRTIVELQHLNSIRGELEITNLHNVKDANEAMQANLVAKSKLNCLKLQWNKNLDEAQEPSSTEVEVAEGVFERLQPPHNLKKLRIFYYIGSRLPNWMARTILPDGLGHLTTLQDLYIVNCPQLAMLPDGLGHLTALQQLWIYNCPKLAVLPDGLGHLTALQKLRIVDFPQLAVLPDGLGHLTALQDLRIGDCPQLAVLPDGLGHLTALQDLYIDDCPQLAVLPDGLGHLTALQDLRIGDCPQLAVLPDGLGHLTALQTLHIVDCPQLAMLPDGLGHLTALQHLVIEKCSQLAMLPDGLGHLTALQHLLIDNCSQLAMLPDGLGHLTALQHLSIDDCPQLAVLPDGLGHLTALQYLRIGNCPQLTVLPDGLGHLTALQNLRIVDCPQLAVLPNGLGHLTALQYLHIIDCPQLARRCKRETGEDWHKIAHIPNVEIWPKEDGEESSKPSKFLSQFGCARCTGRS